VTVINPLVASELVRDHAHDLQSEAASQRRAHDIVTEHLKAVRIFSTCSRKELRAIAKLAKIANVKPGVEIITESDDGNTMYVVLVGTAKVSRGGRKIATVGPGSAFGELALLSKGPRTASVTSLSDMEVAIITRRKLTRVLEEAPDFARKLLEALADMVRENDKKLV
jgi:CRP/FNR family transcriptional regulator, cyclic AMP receptor protein